MSKKLFLLTQEISIFKSDGFPLTGDRFFTKENKIFKAVLPILENMSPVVVNNRTRKASLQEFL